MSTFKMKIRINLIKHIQFKISMYYIYFVQNIMEIFNISINDILLKMNQF